MTTDETTPLIPGKGVDKPKWNLASTLKKAANIENRILLTGFLITLSFSFTQVPIFYIFHLMECQVFYEDHPPYVGDGDQCSRNEIAAGTATQFSILAMSTTLCGTFNLFVAGWMAKRFGPRLALLVQTFVPAIRVATQILGVIAGGSTGMLIIQATQLITILGGPAGYILVINIIAGEIVEPMRRTSVFGMLQGCFMLGQAVGFLTGGMIGDAFGIRRPFEVAFFSFLIAGTFAQFALPYISPESMTDGKKATTSGISGFLAPLKLLAPQKLRLSTGKYTKHYGVLFLCCGVFLGVLATGFAPTLIQMYATAEFEFNQADNGWLMSGFALMRSLFLILMFPPIISMGRKWFTSGNSPAVAKDPEQSPELPTHPEEFDASEGTQTAEEPLIPEEHTHNSDSVAFDLFFLRWSLVVDGGLTCMVAFATQRWHIYLAAFLLPLGSGSAPAAKGVITEMCPPSQRADALSAITLVENFARLATLGFFGFVFAALSEVGKSYLTFFCNAAIALVGMGVLLFSHFPPRGSELVDEDPEDEQGSSTEGEGEGS